MALVTALVVSGCSDEGKDKPQSGPTSVPPSTQAPAPRPEDTAGVQALDVYKQWRAYQLEIDGGTPIDEATVTRLATGRAADLLRRAAEQTAAEGITTHGPDGPLNPTVTVSLSASTPSVTIVDCMDVSRRYVTNRDGSPFTAPPQSPRYVKTFTLTTTNDGWKIADMRSERDRTC
ncbi:hypothetical protein ACIRL2_46820 [Embleya sp. NPDC127516]|uniref:hypothetical protein n=1 Tax=Embleya sp. NPDC127516 TaxID=3363990 RepID=UPI00382AB5BF